MIFLDASTLATSRKVALEVLERLGEVATLEAQARSRMFGPHWSPISVAFGDAGLAMSLLFSNEPRLSSKGVALIDQILGTLSTSRYSTGLLDGLAGLAAVMHFYGRGIFSQHLVKINSEIYRETKARLSVLPADGGLNPKDYDLVYGLTGVARYLLHVAPSGTSAEKLLWRILEVIIKWSNLPAPRGFFVPKSEVPEQLCRESPILCRGFFDLGLAHGIPAPLAILGLAWRAGKTRPGQIEAAETLMQRLYQSASHTDWGLDIAYRSVPQSGNSRRGLSRAAWCYGNVGVARAVQIAGRSFGRKDWMLFASKLLDATFQRPEHMLGIKSAMICHGYSGLLLVLSRLASETKSGFHRRAAQKVQSYTNRVLSMYSSTSPFGFANPHGESLLENDPSFLTGAAGVALTLLALTNSDQSQWDMLLLLS